MIALLLFILGSVILPILVSELGSRGPYFAEQIIEQAASKLPENHRQRYRDEWLAELDMRRKRGQSGLCQLLASLWIFCRAEATASEFDIRADTNGENNLGAEAASFQSLDSVSRALIEWMQGFSREEAARLSDAEIWQIYERELARSKEDDGPSD